MEKHCFVAGCDLPPHFGFGTVRGGTIRFSCAVHRAKLWGESGPQVAGNMPQPLSKTGGAPKQERLI